MNTDCIGYKRMERGLPGCALLREMLCRQEERCPFYKTPEQAEADRRKSFERRYEQNGPFTDCDKSYFQECGR